MAPVVKRTLLPDALKDLWQSVERQDLSIEAFIREQERLLAEYRQMWQDALLLDGQPDLQESLLSELGLYTRCSDLAEIERLCTHAVAMLKQEWQATVTSDERQSIERFYDESRTTMYELMWWHSLRDDASPLAYVTALHFGRQHGCRRYLDFGAGVGSGGILFARHGFDVTLADISSTLLQFTSWRLERRNLPATYVDLKTRSLSRHSFDLVTAMDVFEHLVDPPSTVEQLSGALKPGGLLFARIAAEPDADRPQHIVRDFGPTFERLQSLGFTEVWRDAWLWGHQVFQKT
jgi:2-polyprenyl-3-methyl-5-hydroxy-6-metoxy-1,4-benzoquinol methylase